jgi:hypothetical protein
VKGHLKHLAMCAPMLVIAAVLLIGGASAASLLPFIACVGMMWLMMRMMGEGHQHGHGGHRPDESGERRDAGLTGETTRR